MRPTRHTKYFVQIIIIITLVCSLGLFFYTQDEKKGINKININKNIQQNFIKGNLNDDVKIDTIQTKNSAPVEDTKDDETASSTTTNCAYKVK